MKFAIFISSLLFAFISWSQTLYVPSGASMTVQSEAEITVAGDVENEGLITNDGTFVLEDNWINSGTYMGLEGAFILVGAEDQMIEDVSDAGMSIDELIVDGGGVTTLEGRRIEVLGVLRFVNGVLTTAPGTQFVVDNQTQVIVDDLSSGSYFDGALTLEGGREVTDQSGGETLAKVFPIGNDGVYHLLTLHNIENPDDGVYQIEVSVEDDNPSDPVPRGNIYGVSGYNLWKLKLVQGSIESASVDIDFASEDLENFENLNPIRATTKVPVIAYSDSPGGEFKSLGASSYDGDSLTYGVISSDSLLQFRDSVVYLAIGIEPIVPPSGVFYVPQAFSPAASDPVNRTYRVRGEKIKKEGFSLRIFDPYNNVVFETTNMDEGWDGRDQNTGVELPMGTYFVIVKAERETGIIEQEAQKIYLIR